MEFRRRIDGKLIITKEQKKIMLEEVSQGRSPAEVARKYGVGIQSLVRWKRSITQGAISTSHSTESYSEGVPSSEYRRVVEENNRLRKSLAEMTISRDILKDAVDLAAKKKWI